MRRRVRLPTEFYSPVEAFNQTTYVLEHSNQGDYNPPKSNWQISNNYPHRQNRRMVVSQLPRLWPEFVNPNAVRLYTTPKVPTALTPNSNQPGAPISSEKYNLPKKMYLYNGRLVLE